MSLLVEGDSEFCYLGIVSLLLGDSEFVTWG